MARTAAPILLAAAALLLGAAAPPPRGTVRYAMTPATTKDGAPALQVEMRFRGDADGETVLNLPEQWAGSSELWRHVDELQIGGATSVEPQFPHPVIHHRKKARLLVRYKLRSAWDSDPGFDYEKARPLIRPDWFFAHGEGLFAFPEGRFAGRARFRWGAIPAGWRLVSDLDHLRGKRTTVANMINSVAIGGTGLKLVERQLNGAPLRVAVLGDWSFEPEAMADQVSRIVTSTNAYWGDHNTPFLVALAPLGAVPSGHSYSGTGRTDAFTIAATSSFDLNMATRFLGHEYGHSWIPNELGGLPQEQEAKDYWLSEGFDDYVATKVLLRSGLWSLKDYIADKNETLLRYGTSPAKTADAAAVAERFWTDQAVQQVSYDRGHLLAAMLDARIKAGSEGKKSLDSVLRRQRKAAKGSAELASTLFQNALRSETGIDAAPEIETHARQGHALLLPEDMLGACGRIVTERRRGFHRGYDSAATRRAGGIITGVVPDGAAWRAGMRDGMKLVRFESGKIGDSTVEVTFRIADENGERLIRYLPESKDEYEVQRVVATVESEEAEQGCVKMLAGGQ
jgi:predicted metalloprotease with PDZ domain